MTLRVLYVDDEEDIREVAAMSLELDPELEVRTCAGGEQALAAVSAEPVDVILLDVMMPRMDGPATLLNLRANARTRDIPVIFITARTQAADVKRLIGLGAIGHIAKPFDPLALAGQVRAILEGHCGV
jgi:CheY-like chemotaxis protein